MIVPTLRVGMQSVTLCVTTSDAERPERHSHAERGNDRHQPFVTGAVTPAPASRPQALIHASR
ncbi:hypothetical protein CCU68_21520 [Pseudomonas gingeri NCPPB 3146 = LMG 5327]|uniref:Diguanylate cyclase n=1 Tax=Pseudomonas gingeri NCPPB 3146 = LMG 5327 TaxID=707248 RepID=A0ABX4Y0V0_9PSED|nr:hypothetical protein CCU68_21520 [Pseudomonas gingeri NCPPB 3146 = LMG 5327]